MEKVNQKERKKVYKRMTESLVKYVVNVRMQLCVNEVLKMFRERTLKVVELIAGYKVVRNNERGNV